MSSLALGLSRSLCLLRKPWITHKQLHSCALDCYLCCLIRGILVPLRFLETYSLCWSQGSKCIPTLPVLTGLCSALQPAISKVNHLKNISSLQFFIYSFTEWGSARLSLCSLCKLWRWRFDFKYSHRLGLLSQSFSFKVLLHLFISLAEKEVNTISISIGNRLSSAVCSVVTVREAYDSIF